MNAQFDKQTTNAPRPLDGIKVLDLTSVLMGPFASQIMGDMGADVIKVESPRGDSTRQIGPGRHKQMGGLYLNTNRSKRSIAIDLKKDEGRELLLRLALDADVFFYNVRPQAMARLGLSYEALREVNPRLIYAGVFGYGQEGPYAAKPAYDDLIQGASTLSALFARSTGSAPQYAPAAIADRIAGMSAVNAILAAIIERSRSGEGQRIDVPMFETMVSFIMSDHLAGLSFIPSLDEGGYQRLLTRSRRPYKTKDGYVCAVIYTDRHWRSFMTLLGRESEVDADPRLRSLATRTRHIDALYAEIEQVLGTRTTAEWLEVFERIDIPSLPMHDLQSIFEDPQLKATQFFGTEDHPTEGKLRTLGHAASWSRSQPVSSRHAPRHGEHSREILMQAGLDEEEIESMFSAGIVLENTTQEGA